MDDSCCNAGNASFRIHVCTCRRHRSLCISSFGFHVRKRRRRHSPGMSSFGIRVCTYLHCHSLCISSFCVRVRRSENHRILCNGWVFFRVDMAWLDRDCAPKPKILFVSLWQQLYKIPRIRTNRYIPRLTTYLNTRTTSIGSAAAPWRGRGTLQTCCARGRAGQDHSGAPRPLVTPTRSVCSLKIACKNR